MKLICILSLLLMVGCSPPWQHPKIIVCYGGDGKVIYQNKDADRITDSHGVFTIYKGEKINYVSGFCVVD